MAEADGGIIDNGVIVIEDNRIIAVGAVGDGTPRPAADIGGIPGR